MCSTGSSCGQQGAKWVSTLIFNISYHRHQGLLECQTFAANYAWFNASCSNYLFLAQWRLVLLWKWLFILLLFSWCYYYLLLSLLPWQWFSVTLTLYHKIYELFYLWCQTNLKLQGKLCNKCPSGNSSENAVLATFLCDLWLYIKWQSPQEALWHFGGQYGARDCQNCKMCQFD